MAEAARLQEEVEAAGFCDIAVSSFRTAFVLPSLHTAWDALLDNPSGGALMRQCTDTERRVAKAGFFEAMRRYTSNDERPITLEGRLRACLVTQ
ncbi:MAG: hypothetical protein ACPGUV_04330 [Polyangiales bacterium]